MAYNNIFKKDGSGNFSRTLPVTPGIMSGPGTLYLGDSPTRTLPPVSAPVSDIALTPGQFTNSAPVTPAPRVLPTAPKPTYTAPKTPISTNTPTQTNQTNPYDAFNLLLQDALKTAQKIDTTELLKQQRALQRTVLERSRGTGVTPPTAEELKFLSPAQQESMRSADMGALEPSLDEVAYQITRAQQDRKNAIEAIVSARDAGDKAREFEAEQKWKEADQKLKEATLSETIRKNRADEKSKVGTGNEYDLTPKQSTLFNSLINQQNKSPLIAAADRTPVLENSIKLIRANPSDAAQQLNLSYAYIQALDTYQSAVREGELTNLNSIDSKIGNLQGSIQKIQNGQIVRPEVAKQIADAAETIVTTIKSAAKAKAQSFRSQANVLGIGKAYDAYTAGYDPSYNTPTSTGDGTVVEYQGKQYSVDANGDMTPI